MAFGPARCRPRALNNSKRPQGRLLLESMAMQQVEIPQIQFAALEAAIQDAERMLSLARSMRYRNRTEFLFWEGRLSGLRYALACLCRDSV
jgi:hypothetical protein